MENLPEEKKEIANPPAPRVNVRTMDSDIKSVQESGGQIPQPYTTEINGGNQQPKKETAAPEEISFQPSEFGTNIPGYTGPEEAIFQSENPSSPLPPAQKPNKAQRSVNPNKKSLKVPLIILGVLVVLAAVVWGAMYYLNIQKPVPAPQTSTPEATTTPLVASSTPEIITKTAYISLLNTPSTSTEEEIIGQLTVEGIKNALLTATSTMAIGDFKEVVLRNADQTLVGLSNFITALLPEIKTEDITGNFNDNFTAVLFKDKNGVWPGYIAQLKPTATLIQVKFLIKEELELSALKNLFLTDPGTAAVFKDGLAGNPTINTRYAIFSTPGTALNYGWVNDKLVISSSYAGLLEILKRLQ